MAGQHGTVLFRFKRAFIDLLAERTGEKVAYQSPMTDEDMAASGTGMAVWFDDNADANEAVMVLTGGPQWIDETVRPLLRIQALGLSTDDTQETVDGRASQLLYWAIGILAKDPSVGLTDDDIQEFTALPSTWTYAGGILPTNFRAARFELTIEVVARLKLVLS